MLILLKLLCAHLLADFVLQPLSWIKDKEQKNFRSFKLVQHALVHTLLYTLVLAFEAKYWLGIMVIVITHYVIDAFKCLISKYLVQNDKENAIVNRRSLFLLDQALHLLIIVLVVHSYHPFAWQISLLSSERIWLLLLALLLITVASSVIIKVLISRWTPDQDNKDHSLANAGSYIGILERLFIFVFIVTNHWEGVGFYSPQNQSSASVISKKPIIEISLNIF